MPYTPRYTSAASVYQKTGLTSAECDLAAKDEIIADAEAEVDALCGRRFDAANTFTEYINGPKKDILGSTGQKATSFRLSRYPIQSITEFKILDVNGSTTTTYATLTAANIASGVFSTTDYWLDTMSDPLSGNTIPNGKIILKTTELPTGYQNIKVAGTYGYGSVASPAIPLAIRDLASCLAGVRAWVFFLGGKYNFLSNYSVPQQSVNKGELFERGQKMIDQLTAESERLLDRIGKKPRVLFYASGANR
jgi:hypothetical protein